MWALRLHHCGRQGYSPKCCYNWLYRREVRLRVSHPPHVHVIAEVLSLSGMPPLFSCCSTVMEGGCLGSPRMMPWLARWLL